jgi:hydroxymethylpyrimidine/phosphomethylpyrimidine kinase
MSDDLQQAPRALTIAGSDSGGGAGIQADLKTFAAFGVYGTSAVTAVTAQNTQGVRDWLAMPAELVAQQIDAVLDDIGADALKTGMLPNAEIIAVVASKIREKGIANVVIDPVMVAKGGARLVDDTALHSMVRELLPLALVVTPNLPEAEALTGRAVRSWNDAREAAAAIVAMGARSVVIKGGHFEGDEASATSALDLFYDGRGFREYTAVRVRTTSTHGTGCTFASAIAAGLAKGMGLQDATALAKSYVTLAIQHAYPIGAGHGPLHHFYRYWQPSGARYRPGVPIEAGG